MFIFREVLLSPFIRQLVQRLKDPSQARLHAAILVEGPHMNVNDMRRSPSSNMQMPASTTHVSQRQVKQLPPPLASDHEFPANAPRTTDTPSILGRVSTSIVLSNYVLFVIKVCIDSVGMLELMEYLDLCQPLLMF